MKRQIKSISPRRASPKKKLKSSNREKQQGFTIIELMVTLVVLGVLLSIAVPSFLNWIQTNSLNSYTRNLISALTLARSEAVSRQIGVTVRKGSPQTPQKWSDGFHMYTDPQGNSAYSQVTDTMIREVNLSVDGLTVQTNGSGNNFVSFKNTGTLNEASPVSITVCSRNGKGRLIQVNMIGQVSIGKAEGCDA